MFELSDAYLYEMLLNKLELLATYLHVVKLVQTLLPSYSIYLFSSYSQELIHC